MDDPSAVKLLLGAVTGLVGALGIIWKWADTKQRELREELRRCQEEKDKEHEKRIQDLKEHSKDSELFLRKLEKLQRSDSSPPSSAA